MELAFNKKYSKVVTTIGNLTDIVVQKSSLHLGYFYFNHISFIYLVYGCVYKINSTNRLSFIFIV